MYVTVYDYATAIEGSYLVFTTYTGGSYRRGSTPRRDLGQPGYGPAAGSS